MRRQQGFTLVELVITLIILSIMSVGLTRYVTNSMRIYVDSQLWTSSVSQTRYGLQRLSRELRDALPGSVKQVNELDDRCLEFLPIVAGGRYVDAPSLNAPDAVTAYPMRCPNTPLSACDQSCAYRDPAKHSGRYQLAILDGYQTPQPMTVTGITPWETGDTSCAIQTFQLDGDLPGNLQSVGERFYLVGSPIRYCLSGNAPNQVLYRSQDGTTSLMAEGFSNNLTCLDADCVEANRPFSADGASYQRNNTVKLQLWLEQAGQRVPFVQEVQVENVP